MTQTPPARSRRGLMIILSSPSGAGKSTLARLLLETETRITMSVSATTRARRGNEVDGVHYRFVDKALFEHMRDTGDLLEWAKVHDNFYGTPRAPVEAALVEGRDVLFDIDWQGTRQLYEQAPADIVSIFILPPSVAELKARLERRAEDKPEVIARRLANARTEIARWEEYDYVIVNDDLNRAFDAIKTILAAARLRRERRGDLAAHVAALFREFDALEV